MLKVKSVEFFVLPSEMVYVRMNKESTMLKTGWESILESGGSTSVPEDTDDGFLLNRSEVGLEVWQGKWK